MGCGDSVRKILDEEARARGAWSRRARSLEMRHSVLLGLLVLGFGLGAFFMVYAVMHPERDVIGFISGSATVVIAVLTMAYVYVTSRQLGVMTRQLESMEDEQRLRNQPLPSICTMEAWIEKPRLYFSPPEGEYSAHARYWLRPSIRNIGSHAAIGIDALADIEVRVGEDRRCLRSSAISIPALGQGEDCSTKAGVDETFFFPADTDNAVIRALRQQALGRLPVVNCSLLFRNIMGGCFLLTCRYRLYLRDTKDEAVLSMWLRGMESFWTKHQHDIEDLKPLRDRDREKWRREFDRLERSLGEAMGEENMDLSPWLIPGSYAVEPIDREEYEGRIAEVTYDRMLPGSRGVCDLPGSGIHGRLAGRTDSGLF